ncbi:MAG: hypothetical protein H0W33_05780 [Gammaproteobacteria bacterium]|nr:hypothetical protein [Gammaproteobacteria bacterium]
MRKHFSLPVALAVAFLYGCGSGGSGSLGAGAGGGGGGGGDDDDDGGTASVQLGNGTGAGFVPGEVGVAVPDLAAGGATTLTATIVDENGNLVTGDPVDVSFSSVCSAQGLATIDSPITTSTGIANANYAASGCNGDDVITATATVEDENLVATGMVTVAPASVGSIEFVSATPTNIGLQGTGGSGRSETSVVVFRVVDSSGGPVSGEDVTFDLNTTVGGIEISPDMATTGTNGQVQTVVQAGTVATTVRVTARVTTVTPQVATQSDQLTITTGVPDQDSTSLSIETLNPEAFNIDGTTVPITIRLSDRFNNPVPDGTAITFQTEGGQIGGQCTTVNGACSVDWVSQDPRPIDGRSTLLATAIGEESFTDSNGNGVFDDVDTVFDDIPEPFRDDNFDGIRDPSEPFVDFDVDGSYDSVDGLFNGLLCQHDMLCSSSTSVGVFDLGELVMSGSEPDVGEYPLCVAVPVDATVSIPVPVEDNRGQPMPAGTTVDFETTYGSILGPSSFTYPNTTAPQTYTIVLEGDSMPGSGILFVTTTSPGGLEVSFPITVQNTCP